MTECTHHWQTCPVHNPDGGVPDFITATTCIYGGIATTAGTPWDENDSREVRDRLAAKLENTAEVAAKLESILGGFNGE